MIDMVIKIELKEPRNSGLFIFKMFKINPAIIARLGINLTGFEM